MANCNKYQELSHVQKITFIGMLVHAVQSSDEMFDKGQNLIDLAGISGVFEGVTIMPAAPISNPEETDPK